ncbi:unnamed protein product, partial [Sphacelaria rigidula]
MGLKSHFSIAGKIRKSNTERKYLPPPNSAGGLDRQTARVGHLLNRHQYSLGKSTRVVQMDYGHRGPRVKQLWLGAPNEMRCTRVSMTISPEREEATTERKLLA